MTGDCSLTSGSVAAVKSVQARRGRGGGAVQDGVGGVGCVGCLHSWQLAVSGRRSRAGCSCS